MARLLLLGEIVAAAALLVLGCAGRERSPGSDVPAPPREPWPVPAEWARKPNPVAPDEEALASGREAFERKCDPCHGPAGRGNGPSAVWLDPLPADLTADRVARQSDGELVWKITRGRDPMPGFEESLSANERWEVVHYLRRLADQAEPPAN